MPLPAPFDEKYEILETIGQDGMGAVYRVRHRLIEELRVVRIVRFPVEPTPALAERFLGAAWKASRLRHPNLAILYDYAVTADGRAVLVLENVEGLSLREVLRHFGTPPLAVTLEIGRQVCRALGALHEQRILHSDLSPDSLLLTRDSGSSPLVKLLDLGLARSLEGDGEGLSTGGVLVGKLRYAAPEQLGVGDLGDRIDGRSDLYSLGIVLYELLTGRSPFDGHDPRSWMAAHLFGTPLDFAVSDPEGVVPEDLRVLVMHALARHPEQRIASAEDFGQALEAIQTRYPLVGDELAPVFGEEPAVSEPAEGGPLPLAPSPVPATTLPPGTGEGEPAPLPLLLAEPLSSDWAVAPLSRSGWEGGGRAGEGTGEGAEAAGPAVFEPLEAPIPPPRRRAPLLPAALPIAVMLVLAFFVFLKGKAWWNPQAKEGPPVPPIVAAPPAPAPKPAPVTEEAASSTDEALEVPDQEIAADQVPSEFVPDRPIRIAERPPEPRAEERPHPRPLSRLPPHPRRERGDKKQEFSAFLPSPGARAGGAGRGVGGEGLRVPSFHPVVAVSRAPMRRGDLIQPGPGVSVPVPLEIPRFTYPAAARGRASSDVDIRLDLLVDEHGKVIDAVVREGDKDGLGFNEAALEAARKVPFQPATRNDVPGKMWTEMIFEFSASR